MRKFTSFTKIGQFRQTVSNIRHATQYKGIDANGTPMYDFNAKMPIITFKGTVKLHGTNAGVVQDAAGEMWFQSRKNIITPQKDNAGFAFFANSNKEFFENMIADIRIKENLNNETIAVFGEWAGKGIQKGIAIAELDKMFVIFAVKVVVDAVEDDANYYLHEDKWNMYSDPDNRIFNINDFESYYVDIDFNNPDLSRNTMIEIMEAVEKECPVGKAFGLKPGEHNTTGEGNVWQGWYNGNRYIFKVKGEKHSVSKVKKLAPVDVEKLNSINEFVDYAVTENRLNQAIEQVFTIESKIPTVKDTGDFIRWVINDIATEEADTLVSNGLEPKDVNKKISGQCRNWFMNKLDEIAGLNG